MEENTKEVLFDPGFSRFVNSFMYYNEQVKMMLNKIAIPSKKSFKYRALLPQIIETMQQEIGFYYACLLWATYIKKENENSPKEIAGNTFLGKTEEELKDFDYLAEVNYLLNFFEEFPKHLTKLKINYPKINNKYIKTVEIYKKFLNINKSFINTKTTEDINLPEEIKDTDKTTLETIKKLIDKTTRDGNFKRLFEIELF